MFKCFPIELHRNVFNSFRNIFLNLFLETFCFSFQLLQVLAVILLHFVCNKPVALIKLLLCLAIFYYFWLLTSLLRFLGFQPAFRHFQLSQPVATFDLKVGFYYFCWDFVSKSYKLTYFQFLLLVGLLLLLVFSQTLATLGFSVGFCYFQFEKASTSIIPLLFVTNFLQL